MGFGKQLGVVLWKNWILQKRRVCVTILEVLIPVFFAALLLLIRVWINAEEITTPTNYTLQNTIPDASSFHHPLIGYAPRNNATDQVVAKARTLLVEHMGSSVNTTFMPFDTEQHALDFFKINSNLMRLIIIFYDVDGSSTELPSPTKFAVRPFTGDSNWNTRRTYPFFQTNEPRNGLDEPYYDSRGVLYMQRLMGEALIQYRMAEEGLDPTTVSMAAYKQRMAYPPYVDDSMIFFTQSYLPLFLILSLIICVVINTKNLVYEKERKLKESMKLMGLTPAVYWLSWFITLTLYLIPAIVLYAVFLCTDIIPDKGAVLNNSDPFLFFLFLLCYGLAVISFCFMVSTFVQKANVAAAFSGILFFAFYFPYWFIDPRYEDLSRSEKLGSCVSFNLAMGLGAKVIGIYEGTGEGVQFSNFHKPGTVDDNLSLLECMLMLLVDTLIHFFITWYLDNVRPGEFGVPKPFYFPFMKTYWCGNDKKASDSYDAPASQSGHFEKDPSDLHAGIKIKNIRKVFDKKVAVEGMSLNMYEGQITVLLGHNGAGKTTTMSMLTGFIPVTSGTASVNGYDICDNISAVRGSLGLCPQHNVLFDTMTVHEHLEFFAILKGMPKDAIKPEIISLSTELGILNKLHDHSANLSGGQKRKLSVAIALIGGSKVVVLDEPSSGMDPAARRQTWTVLEKHRQGRTMLLTTHYMDEADVLGDRIAIMAEGVVKCCGSSMFLKKLYGAGYHLVVVKEPDCNVDTLTSLVKSHVSTSALEGIINTEVTYLLPDNASASFPALFDDLEAKKTSLGISSFGTSATTMEEVFLKVGESGVIENDSENGLDSNYYGSTGYTNPVFTGEKQHGPDSLNGLHFGKNKVEDSTEMPGKPQELMSFNKGYTKKTGLLLELSKMKGLFVKKALLTWRNRAITMVQLLLPVITVIVGLTFEELRPESSKAPALNFDLSPFDRTYIPITTGHFPQAADEELARFYGQQFNGAQTLEKFNLTNYATYDDYLMKRASELGTSSYNKKVIIGLESLTNDSLNLAAIAHYNGEPYHAEPISINMMMNGFLQYYLNGSYSLQTSINPLPKDEEADKKFDYFMALYGSMSLGIFIVFGMAFLTTLFIYYPIKERQVGAKHMQIVSGVSPLSYWIPTFLWDFICYLIPNLLVIVVFIAYSKEAYINDGRWLIVILILIMYGWAVLPFTYALSFAFKEPPSGVVSAIMLNIVSGLVTVITVTVLKTPSFGTADTADILDWIFIIIFPNYSMVQSFVNMDNNYQSLKSCLKEQPFCAIRSSPCCQNWCFAYDFCLSFEENYLSMDRPGIGIYLIFLAIDGFVCFAIILLIEYNVFTKLMYLISSPSSNEGDPQAYENNASMAEDSDVASERQRLNSSPASVLSSTDPLLLVNLYKRYGNFVAVDHICVGVPEQECFGLLGQNGAGKTTTFKMLTGDVMVTGGNAYLQSNDVRSSIKEVQANMGYCPQFDALLDQMTGRETLTMYARLRGIPQENIKSVVNELLDCLMLKPHADKLAGAYSGGNKRKLSTAIALVGDPHFLLLDEPSAGMDPKARRQLWNVLSQIRASGRTLVLTSHSMEECDALCTRIAIMVNGKFVCLGSPQHLKNKFGQGYTLIVQLGDLPDGTTASIDPVINFICEHLPGTKVFDNHHGYIHFQVPDANVSLSRVFSLMESTKVNLNVRDYSVHQTTLEQVFLTFTRSQVPPKEAKKTSMCTKLFCCCCICCGLMK